MGIKIYIPGKPHPQERARSVKKQGPRKQPVKAKSQKSAELFFKIHAAKKLAATKQLQGPVFYIAEYVFDRPRHHSKSGELRPTAPDLHTNTPDRSNLDKHVEDCLNKSTYKDDSQISTGFSRKRYTREGEEAHTTVILIEDRPEFWQKMIRALSEENIAHTGKEEKEE